MSQTHALLAPLVKIAAAHRERCHARRRTHRATGQPGGHTVTDRQPTDLVVVLPGITGSTLYQDGKPVWEPSAGAILHALFTLGGSLRSLRLPDGIGDSSPDDGVEARALIDDVHVIPGIWSPIKGYDTLVTRLQSLGYRQPTPDRPGNLLPMPYDWRLSNRYTAAWMAPTIQRELDRWQAQGGRYADAKVTFVAHSMGGLVARWYAAHQGADHTGKIITFGTPMRGSMNAVDQLVHGAPSSLGPLRGLITDLSRTLPSLHQLLPAYACVVGDPGAEPTHLAADQLPGGNTTMVADGLAFYEQLETAEAGSAAYAKSLHAIVGTNQPTQSTVRFSGGDAVLLSTYGDEDYLGDSTVPLVGAIPAGLAMDTNTVHHVPDNHGNLQRNAAALDELEAVLTAKPVVIKGDLKIPISVTVPQVVAAGQPLEVTVAVAPGSKPGLHATLRPAVGKGTGTTRVLRLDGGLARASFEDLRPGAYLVDVTGAAPGSPVAPVSAAALVWDPSAPIQ
jgi:pimeloyl-ACP methyl ester carboxylesterase